MLRGWEVCPDHPPHPCLPSRGALPGLGGGGEVRHTGACTRVRMLSLNLTLGPGGAEPPPVRWPANPAASAGHFLGALDLPESWTLHLPAASSPRLSLPLQLPVPQTARGAESSSGLRVEGTLQEAGLSAGKASEPL